MAELQVGIIGCGRMGRERARCVSADGVLVRFVMDEDGALAASLAREHGARVAATMADLEKCDAVFLCTPPDVRVDHVRWAIGARVPFFAEKPMALDHVVADKVTAMLVRTPVVNAVGYMNRWRRSIRHGRALLASRRILGFTAHWANRPYRVPWWLQEDRSGGPHNEQATHLFDLARFLCGEIRHVHAVAAHPAAGAMATTVATTLAFESGAIGAVLYTCEAAAKDIGLRIVTTEGSIAFSSWEFILTENTIDQMPMAAGTEDVFLLETRGFLEAVRTGDPSGLLSDWTDANKTQQVMDAIGRDLRDCALGSPTPGKDQAIIVSRFSC